jgi:hypothetical protein
MGSFPPTTSLGELRSFYIGDDTKMRVTVKQVKHEATVAESKTPERDCAPTESLCRYLRAVQKVVVLPSGMCRSGPSWAVCGTIVAPSAPVPPVPPGPLINYLLPNRVLFSGSHIDCNRDLIALDDGPI